MRTGNLEWADTTSYSQSIPVDERVPRMWGLTRMRYTVTVYSRDGRSWYLCCREQNIWDMPISYSGDNPEIACTTGLKLFSQLMRRRATDAVKNARDAEYILSEATGGMIAHGAEITEGEVPLSM
jgi:hypothetical protein